MNQIKIYKLLHPKTKEPFYVGSTREKYLIVRLAGHIVISKKRRNPLGEFIDSLDECPIIELIEECELDKNKLDRERFWIVELSKNHKLFNQHKTKNKN